MADCSRPRLTVSDYQKEEATFFYKEFSDGTCVYDPPTEFDQGLNQLTRMKISCFRSEHPESWLGVINARGSEKNLEKDQRVFVYNFGADFIVPACDEALVLLLEQWREKAAVKLLDQIQDRIASIGGVWLHWV